MSAPVATDSTRPAPPPLRCTVCGGPISAVLTYNSAFTYSEHRDLTGYECDDYACGAEWDKNGEPT